jgi:hypothetical protein
MFDLVREAYEAALREPSRGAEPDSVRPAASSRSDSTSPPSADDGSGTRSAPPPPRTPPPPPTAPSPPPASPITSPRAVRLPGLVAVAVLALLVFVGWRLIFHGADDALTAADDGATVDTYDAITPTKPAPSLAATPTTTSPTPTGPTCADLTPVKVSYRWATETSYGLTEYWPLVTIVNGSAYPVRVTTGGWAKSSSTISPDFPNETGWANNYLDVPAGGTGTQQMGRQTGEYLQLAAGEKILNVHLTATLRVPDAWLAGQCEVSIGPAT